MMDLLSARVVIFFPAMALHVEFLLTMLIISRPVLGGDYHDRYRK